MNQRHIVENSIGRRRFIQSLGATGVTATAGCSSLGGRAGDLANDVKEGQISGTVIDKDGKPINGASIEFIRKNEKIIETKKTDPNGQFESSFARPIWVRVTHPGFTSQIRAVGPGDQIQFRLFQDTVSLGFTGDVMFGRRFFQPNPDSSAPRVEFASIEEETTQAIAAPKGTILADK